MKIVTNLKHKMIENKECQCLTKNIVHLAKTTKYEYISSKLKWS